MAVSITMPQLGESVTEGTVTRWLKDVGDTVAVDEPLLEVSTDKVDTEIPSPIAGVLLEIKAVEDDVVPVGGELAIVGETAEAPAVQAPAAPAVSAEPVPAAPAPTPAAAPAAAPAVEVATAPAAPAAEPAAAAPTASSAAATAIVLPALGESVTEGTVTRWLKQVGDSVEVDEAILEVSTDKVDTEIPSPVAGVLTEILVNEDETVDVGSTLALVSAAGTPATPAAATAPAAPATPAAVPAPIPAHPAPTATSAPTAAPAVSGESADVYASPIVRKLAKEKGVELAAVVATGAGGRITKDDVLSLANSAPTPAAQPAPAVPARASAPTAELASPRGQTVPMSRLRRVIADRMVESLHVAAQLTTVVEIDVSRIASLRARAKQSFLEREGVPLSFLPFFARAALEALKAFPTINASVDSDSSTVTYHDVEHLGIAVDTERGLLVPVVRDASDLTLAGLARRIADLAERTRTGKVAPDDLSGGTFTLTNTGSRGALFDTPIINQPQVAILATGAVVKRPIVATGPDGDDVIAIRSMAYFALTYDHRIVDGAEAARFLGALKSRLESAEFDAELGL